ncbi:MAG: rhamnulokinase family protein, partial [Traorella sp.]
MIKYYLAVDIGASSGRHILAHMENGKMCLEEIYRFSNELIEEDGHLCWDIDHLFQEVKNGLKKCFSLGKAPVSMGIDTWAVDFVLLDEKDQRIGNAVSYRDSRTNHMDEEVYKVISEKELYQRCGIQKQIFNTIYQVMALQKQDPIALSKAKTLLMIPDYLNYCLTGKKYQEYTNATTTGLVNPTTHDWDDELIEKLNYPREIFQEMILPKTNLGDLSREVQKEVGGNCQVVCPPTHDTASAVLAVPSLEDHVLYISSGTWSLMGSLRDEADCSEESRLHNFTNEGGYDFKYRYLKNIMGLWMIQSVKKQFQEQGMNYSYAQLCELARQEKITSLVDCND